MAGGATTAAWRLGLGFAGLLAAAGAANGAERFPTLDWSFEGSLPVHYTDNAIRDPRKQSDWLLTPYLKLSASGRLDPGVEYSVYASGGHDRFGRIHDNDDAFATLGGNIVKRWGRFSFGASYEHTYIYDGLFAARDSIVNDASLSARYTWKPNSDLRITPGGSVSARFDQRGTFQRHVYSAKIDIEQRLHDRWWFVTTPRVRYYDYSADDAGRRDLLLSVSTGLRYEFNDSVSLTALVGYENRSSNLQGNGYDNFTAGVSLDFSTTFERLR